MGIALSKEELSTLQQAVLRTVPPPPAPEPIKSEPKTEPKPESPNECQLVLNGSFICLKTKGKYMGPCGMKGELGQQVALIPSPIDTLLPPLAGQPSAGPSFAIRKENVNDHGKVFDAYKDITWKIVPQDASDSGARVRYGQKFYLENAFHGQQRKRLAVVNEGVVLPDYDLGKQSLFSFGSNTKDIGKFVSFSDPVFLASVPGGEGSAAVLYPEGIQSLDPNAPLCADSIRAKSLYNNYGGKLPSGKTWELVLAPFDSYIPMEGKKSMEYSSSYSCNPISFLYAQRRGMVPK